MQQETFILLQCIHTCAINASSSGLFTLTRQVAVSS